MITAKKTLDGREIKILYMYGYEYHLVEAKSRRSYDMTYHWPQPCFLGYSNFGLRFCKKISKYKKSLLNFK